MGCSRSRGSGRADSGGPFRGPDAGAPRPELSFSSVWAGGRRLQTVGTRIVLNRCGRVKTQRAPEAQPRSDRAARARAQLAHCCGPDLSTRARSRCSSSATSAPSSSAAKVSADERSHPTLPRSRPLTLSRARSHLPIPTSRSSPATARRCSQARRCCADFLSRPFFGRCDLAAGARAISLRKKACLLVGAGVGDGRGADMSDETVNERHSPVHSPHSVEYVLCFVC